MHKTTITAKLKTDIKTVWAVVTDNTEYGWRKDLSRIEIEDETHFTEFTTDDYPTHFTITEKEDCRSYGFRIKNSHTEGTWRGRFSRLPDGGTKIEFTEEIEVKNPFMNLLCYLLRPYKKMQECYVYDLKVKLGEA